jgi:hypothetical protein
VSMRNRLMILTEWNILAPMACIGNFTLGTGTFEVIE